MHRTVFFCSLLLISSVAFAVEVGVEATSESAVAGDLGTDASFSQRARGELALAFDPAEPVSLFFSGGYQYVLSDPNPLDWDNVVLSELSYSLRAPLAAGGVFDVTLGRFFLEDSSGAVYRDQIDGATVSMSVSTLSLTLSAGYTGLLFEHDTTVLVSAADALARGDDNPLGPPRSVAEVSGEMELPGVGMTLSASLLAQFDLRDPAELAQAGDTTIGTGGAVNTQYQTLALSGTAAGAMEYRLAGTVNTGSMLNYDGSRYVQAPVRALLAVGSVVYAPPGGIEPRVALSALFATGDDDSTAVVEGNGGGAATAFIPLSVNPVAAVVDPFLTNLFRGRLGVSLAPFGFAGPEFTSDTLRVSLDVTTFLQPSTGASPFDGVGTGFQGYVGTEVALGLELVPVPFFRLEIDSGLFFPATRAFGSDALRYSVSGTASLSF